MKDQPARWKGAPPALCYDPVAETYNRRFASAEQPGISTALQALAHSVKARRALEAGCGTGRWLGELGTAAEQVVGLDLSAGMLAQAKQRGQDFDLIRASAENLPFRRGAFDLVICVNALHHFNRPRDFIQSARQLLATDGVLGVIGMDPHAGRDRWYVYQYFAGTYQADLERYPSVGDIREMMAESGFDQIETRPAEHIQATRTGREILQDPMFSKNSTSQLILLSEEAYGEGILQISEAICKAEAAGEEVIFPVDITLYLVAGTARGG